MKTEKEIRDRLEWLLKILDSIKAEYNKYVGTSLEDRYLVDICADWDECEAKIRTLQWVLGE